MNVQKTLGEKSPNLSIILFCFLLLFIPTGSFAQSELNIENDSTNKHIQTLDKIVVTATSTSRKLSETPASVSVLDAVDIEMIPAQSVEDILTFVPNTVIKRSVPLGEGIPSSIIMRGIPAALVDSRTLIQWD